jgi:hypothetical protein
MSWTHAICGECWIQTKWPDENGEFRGPVRVMDAPKETCCFCGRKTRVGIYVREDPAKLACTHDREPPMRYPDPEGRPSRCICPFGVVLGDCPEHGHLVPP